MPPVRGLRLWPFGVRLQIKHGPRRATTKDENVDCPSREARGNKCQNPPPDKPGSHKQEVSGQEYEWDNSGRGHTCGRVAILDLGKNLGLLHDGVKVDTEASSFFVPGSNDIKLSGERSESAAARC